MEVRPASWMVDIAQNWAIALSAVYTGESMRVLQNELLSIVSEFVNCLLSDPFRPEAAKDIGLSIVHAGEFTQPYSLSTSLAFLSSEELIKGIDSGDEFVLLKRVVELIRYVSEGYFAGAYDLVLQQQEAIRVAMTEEAERFSIIKQIVESRSSQDDELKMPILTRRQREILVLLAENLSIEQIAGRIGIKPPTVQQHLNRLYKAMGVNNRGQAVRQATKLRIL